jgi:hypothetical protein
MGNKCLANVMQARAHIRDANRMVETKFGKEKKFLEFFVIQLSFFINLYIRTT